MTDTEQERETMGRISKLIKREIERCDEKENGKKEKTQVVPFTARIGIITLSGTMEIVMHKNKKERKCDKE